jgi:hypothetical protein
MKNWFSFNNTDYKTALMPIVEYVDKELRPELRESEKTVTAGLNVKGKIKELCSLCKSDKKIADGVLKALTKDYNTSLDYVLAGRYLKNKWMKELNTISGWVDWSTAFKKLYEKLGSDFLCEVLKDMELGNSDISGGSSNSIITDIYNKFAKGNKVTAFYDSNKLEYHLNNLKTEIDGFLGSIEKTLNALDKFEYNGKCTYQYSSDFNSKEAIYNIRVRRTDNEIRNYSYVLSEGLKSELRNYKYFGTTKREIPSIIKDIEEFLK